MEPIGTVVGKILAEVDTGASRVSRLQRLARQANRNGDGGPVLLDRSVDVEIPRRLIAFRPATGPVEIRREMAPQERGEVEARAAALELWVAPFSPDDRAEIEASIGAMLGGFRSMRQQGADLENILAITCAVLREFPAWAIKKACLKIARRETKLDGRFAPNDGEIVDVVYSLVEPYRRQLDQARALLEAFVEQTHKDSPSFSDRPFGAPL